MIPQRFLIEYPARCKRLLNILEREARDYDLLGSFAILVACAAFNIPFNRLSESLHPLEHSEVELGKAMKQMAKESFLKAPFWESKPKHLFFRYSKIVNQIKNAKNWRDENGIHPIDSEEDKDCNTALRTIRNALAHGNIIYLDKDGGEIAGKRVQYIALLSRHDSEKNHFRVVIFDEESFLIFLKSWVNWLLSFAETNS